MSYNANAQAAQLIIKLALVQNTITTIGTLEGQSPAVLNTVYVAVTNALAPVNAAISGYEADIDTTTFAGVGSQDAVTMAKTMLSQMQDVTQESALLYMRAYLTRSAFNVKNYVG